MPELIALLACGDQNKVGSQSLLKFSPAPAAPSPSPSPVHSQPAAVSHPTVKPVVQQPPAVVRTVDITTNSPYYSPHGILTVTHGTIVKFVNQDTQPDFIEILNGTGAVVARSPGNIAPGASWSYTFSTPGGYQIADRRPYTQGMLAVNVT